MIMGILYCFNWLQGYLIDDHITSSRPYFNMKRDFYQDVYTILNRI